MLKYSNRTNDDFCSSLNVIIPVKPLSIKYDSCQALSQKNVQVQVGGDTQIGYRLVLLRLTFFLGVISLHKGIDAYYTEYFCLHWIHRRRQRPENLQK